MEEMNQGELIKELSEKNTLQSILLLTEECKDLEELKEKIKTLLNK